MAKCPGSCADFDGSGNVWFKIDQAGLLSGTVNKGEWGNGVVLDTLQWTSTIPASLAPGNYLIRVRSPFPSLAIKLLTPTIARTPCSSPSQHPSVLPRVRSAYRLGFWFRLPIRKLPLPPPRLLQHVRPWRHNRYLLLHCHDLHSPGPCSLASWQRLQYPTTTCIDHHCSSSSCLHHHCHPTTSFY